MVDDIAYLFDLFETILHLQTLLEARFERTLGAERSSVSGKTPGLQNFAKLYRNEVNIFHLLLRHLFVVHTLISWYKLLFKSYWYLVGLRFLWESSAFRCFQHFSNLLVIVALLASKMVTVQEGNPAFLIN